MKIIILAENSTHTGSAFLKEHGLSMYFEHGEKRILFDTGASDKFIYNATLLGIDLHKVDTCIISHPHNDHTGGLKSFLEINRNARVVIKRAAQGDFYTKRGHKMIRTGLEPGFFDKYAERMHFFDDFFEVKQGLFAAGIHKYRRQPQYTALMFEKRGELFVQDELEHELFVAISTQEGTVVLTGCAHHGVQNVLLTAEEKFGRIIGVAGGFHLGGTIQGKRVVKKEPESEIHAIARFLEDRKIKKVYTGHCTGENAVEKLSVLARGQRMRVGDTLEF